MINSKIIINSDPNHKSGRSLSGFAPDDVRTKNRKRLTRLYITAIVLLSMMFTVYVWQATKMVEIKLRIEGIKREITLLENTNSDLRGDISSLQALTRIEDIAKNELGMKSRTRRIYLVMPGYTNE